MQTLYNHVIEDRPVRRDMPILRLVLALAFIVLGSLHFVYPERYMQIMPAFLPAPRALVLISGLCEVLGGIGLLVPMARRFSGYGLIALLIAVFPANINMALQYVHTRGYSLVTILWLLRLPVQFVLIELVRRCALTRTSQG